MGEEDHFAHYFSRDIRQEMLKNASTCEEDKSDRILFIE